PVLLEAVKSADADGWKEVRQALAAVGPPAADDLFDALKKPGADEATRVRLLNVVADIGSLPNAQKQKYLRYLSELVKGIKDPRSPLRKAAQEAYDKIQ